MSYANPTLEELRRDFENQTCNCTGACYPKGDTSKERGPCPFFRANLTEYVRDLLKMQEASASFSAASGRDPTSAERTRTDALKATLSALNDPSRHDRELFSEDLW